MQAMEEFGQTFKQEHREIRDALLNLLQAFRTLDRAGINKWLGETAKLTGPHFRYEEEALYPSLTAVLDDEYVAKLLSDHDGAIATARKLVALVGRKELAEADAREGAKYVRTLLPHVFECDGLAIVAELLPEREIRATLSARQSALAAGLDLLSWASNARQRTPA